MPQVVEILRLRQKRSKQGKKNPAPGLILRAILGSLSLLLLGGVLVVASFVIRVTADLPSVTSLGDHFGILGREAFTPVRFFDREGEILLYEALNPAAKGARWLYVKEDGLIDIQEHTLRAILAAVEPDYLSEAPPTIIEIVRDFFNAWVGGPGASLTANIAHSLTDSQLLPLGMQNVPENVAQARRQLLGQELSRTYSKFQILEWFLNSTDFGHDSYGLDAAALVYLGKHASELSLAESALLAPIALQPSINPFSALEENRERQERVLDTMVDQGWITRSQARQAKQESVLIASKVSQDRLPLEEILARWLRDRLGKQALNRNGLVVYTTIDAEMQQQAECVLATQLERLDGGVGNETVPTTVGAPCLAASLLPPLRPRDQGVQHNTRSGAFVVLDPQSGEILALAGQVDIAAGADTILSPLIYLTAFSKGYSPGSMIMDLPLGDSSTAVEGIEASLQDAHGPVRIRTALVNLYNHAAEQTMKIVGVESVVRIGRSLGLSTPLIQLEPETGEDRWRTSLFDLTAAYGVLAFQGQKVGARVQDQSANLNGVDLQPEILFEVEDGNRRLIYRYRAETSAVVSPQLAYLINDILRDEPARWPLYGTGNVLEIGRPTAAIAGISTDGDIAWTVGYTPAVVVGVWMGNLAELQPQALTVSNSAGAVWHAIMQYVIREMPAQDWSAPPGVNVMDVCDPSGLLPTVYCPEVVNEVFSAGTEPHTFDNLYQPFQVNLETGKLATLFTPIDQVEERVYLVPPPEALAWASAVGLELPPSEYDTLTGEVLDVPGVKIQSPEAFDFVRGEISIRGQATIQEFSYYRLRYGEGLNPTQWVQIGEGRDTPVTSGRLGLWDTSELDGLYTLQLIVVDEDGQLFSSAVNLTIDNQPPEVEIILPLEGQAFTTAGEEIVLQVAVDDAYGVAEVAFYIDDVLIEALDSPPYSTRWRESVPGSHTLNVQAVDLAGNQSEMKSIVFAIN